MQVGVDHVALDRPGAHDRHLDHQVVEVARLEARQHGHLGAALDLEDADGIGLAEHVEDPGVAAGDRGQVEPAAVVDTDEVEGLVDAGQHAEPQHVDLQDAEGVQVVLVPLDDRAVLHGGVLDGHQLRERPAGHDEAAHVLRQVAGKADQLARQLEGEPEAPVAGVEAQLAQARRVQALAAPAPERAGQGRDPVGRQAQRLADLADGAAAAIADDGGGQPRPVAAVLRVDVLDHLLAALVLEVDVDVGGLVALGADEALEQQVEARRIDRGDAQAIADRRVGGRAAALAEDVARAREAHQVVDGEEIGRVAQLADERQLVLDRRPDPGRHAARITLARPQPGQVGQLLLWVAALAGRLVRIFVAQLVEAEGAAAGDLQAARQGLGMVAEEVRHLGGRLQMALGVGLQAEARLVDGAARADAGEHVEQHLAPGPVHARVVGGQQRRAALLRQRRQRGQAPGVVAPVEVPGGQVAGAGPGPRQPGQRLAEGRVGPGGRGPGDRQVVRRQDGEDLALGMRQQLGQRELAGTLPGSALAEGQQAAEPGIGGPVGGKAQHLRPIARHQAGADDEAQPRLLGRHVGAHHAGQRVAVGDADGGQPQRLGRQHQLVRVRGPAQEAVVGRDPQLGIGGHGAGSRPPSSAAQSGRKAANSAKAEPFTLRTSLSSAVTTTLPRDSARAR
jgi:hypothetical protein